MRNFKINKEDALAHSKWRSVTQRSEGDSDGQCVIVFWYNVI